MKPVKTLLAVVCIFLAQASCSHQYGRFEPPSELDLAPGPRFSLQYTDAIFPKGYELSQKTSGPFILEFFFYGCRACRDNRKAFHQVASEVASYATVFELSIDCEAGKLRQWAEETNPSWPVLSVCDLDLVDDLEVKRFPTTLVLDKERQVILRHVGVWSPEAREKILAAIKRESHLQGKP